MEHLEQRRLLSVSATTLLGPTGVGTQKDYETLENGVVQYTSDSVVDSPTTFNGSTVSPLQTTIAPHGLISSEVIDDYHYIVGGSLLNYGSLTNITDDGASTTDTITVDPAFTILPASMTPGVFYTASYTGHSVQTGAVTASSSAVHNYIVELVSDSTVSLSLPGGTFDAYQVNGTLQTIVSGAVSSSTTTEYFYSPTEGLVQTISGTGASMLTTELTGTGSGITVGSPAQLLFALSPSNSTSDQAPSTAFKVVVADANGDTVTTDTSTVTLALNSPNGAVLLGTTAKSAVAGIAAFDTAAISAPGTFTVTATDGALASAVSSPVTVAQGFSSLSSAALTVTGTAGDDTIVLASNGTLLDATLNGVTATAMPLANVTSININGGSGNDTITLGANVPGSSVQGGPGDDTITGGPGDDTLGGGQGNDYILGGAGDDLIHGGAGDDSIGGGQGNDNLYGGLGNDTITGGAGDDTLTGGAGDNLLRGGAGDDLFFAINGNPDTLYGGTGNNSAHIDQNLDQIPNNDIQTILFN
jgi:Ca2+-binding RTX toxin-like protein